MVTPRKLPFEVRLHFASLDGSKVRALRNFTDKIEEADIDDTYLIEYHPCSLEFAALEPDVPADARLYVDRLDALADPGLAMDDERIYIRCGTTVEIQRPDDARFPWIPGNYRVEVRWGGRSYYTVLQVRPKDMTMDQLRMMREELERYVVGLTLDLIRRAQGFGDSELAHHLPLRFYQYQLLEDKFPVLYAVLQDIVRRPKHEVWRTHTIRPTHRITRQDQKSYQWMHSAAGYARNRFSDVRSKPLYALAPLSTVRYDLPENRWVKRILKQLIAIMDDIADSIERLSHSDWSMASRLNYEKSRYLGQVRRLQARLRSILAHPLFEEVQDVYGPLPYTPAMQRDGRYRTLYRFWWDLIIHSEVKVNASFEYQWKKTDLLWEYWAFVRTIRALRVIGFEPVSGWIFDETWSFPDRVFIPTIPEGTKVVMRRDDERVEIHYLVRLPKDKESARLRGSLLYVLGNNNWPDIRLDYYKADAYEYSVVVEAKYRKSRNIWPKDKSVDFSKWTPVMRQIQDYRDKIKRLDDVLKYAVREVIVLYPKDAERATVSDEGDQVVLIQLMPDESDEHYIEHLRELLRCP
ncbi:MAG: DUF2357 domain-containing protein [Firmicutes bacterium]|nr:DUF2357 domain-containing protein [Bacillota bacterium]